MMTRRRSHTVTSIFIVYDADGSRAGELLYILRKLLGIAHCAACDITHGPRTEKPEFTELKTSAWNVPVYNIHRDEMDASLAALVGDTLPVVVARTVAEVDVLLLGPRQLDECCGSVVTLEASINAALAGAHLFVPPFPAQPPQRRPPAERTARPVLADVDMPSLVPPARPTAGSHHHLDPLPSPVPVENATAVPAVRTRGKLGDVLELDGVPVAMATGKDVSPRIWRPQVVPGNGSLQNTSTNDMDDSMDDAVVPGL